MNLLNTISHTDAVELLGSLPDGSIDMALTSPPYDNLRTYGGHSEFDFETIAQETYRVLKPGGVLVWVVGDATINGSETLTSMRQALHFVDTVGFRMHDTMIYHRQGRFPESNRYWQDFEYMLILSKGQPISFNSLKEVAKYGGKKVSTERQKDGRLIYPKNRRVTTSEKALSNIWYISRGDMLRGNTEALQHPAMFPEKLAERHILTWSNPGDVVLDYFMGSGTTAKMARATERNYIGCDVNEEYVKLARNRLAKPYTPNMFILQEWRM